MKSFHKLILALLTVALCFVVACGKTAKKTRLNRGSGPTDYSKTQLGPQNSADVRPGSVGQVGTAGQDPQTKQDDRNKAATSTRMETDSGSFEIKEDGAISSVEKSKNQDERNQDLSEVEFESIALIETNKAGRRLVIGLLNQGFSGSEICQTELNNRIQAKLDIPFDIIAGDAAKSEEAKMRLLTDEMSVFINKDLITNKQATSSSQLKKLNGLEDKKIQLAEDYDLGRPEKIKRIKGIYNVTAIESGKTKELMGTFDAILCN